MAEQLIKYTAFCTMEQAQGHATHKKNQVTQTEGDNGEPSWYFPVE